jgi:hypothetical protein
MAIHAAFNIDPSDFPNGSRKAGVSVYYMPDSKGSFTVRVEPPLGSWKNYLSVSTQKMPKLGETFELAFRADAGGGMPSATVSKGIYKCVSLAELRASTKNANMKYREPFTKRDGVSHSAWASSYAKFGGTPAVGSRNNNIDAHGNPVISTPAIESGLYAIHQSGSGASAVYIYPDNLNDFGKDNIEAAIDQRREEGNEEAAKAIEKETGVKGNTNPSPVPAPKEQAKKSQAVPITMAAGGLGVAGYAAMMPAVPLRGKGRRHHKRNRARGLNGGLSNKQIYMIVGGLALAITGVIMYNKNDKFNKQVDALKQKAMGLLPG